MELSAKYAYRVYDKKSFSAAAKSLYISQPALSTSISRLEGELGFKIFDRSTSPLSLTPEGKIYIESLEEIMESEAVMKRRIKQLSDMSAGTLSIGGASVAAYTLIAAVCAEFSKRYPKIAVEIDIGNTRTEKPLYEKVRKHTLDLMIGYDFSTSAYAKTPLFDERLIIAARRDLPDIKKFLDFAVTRDELISSDYPESKEIEDLSVFGGVRFITHNSNSNIQKYLNRLIPDHVHSSYSIKNVQHAVMHYNMMCAGLGALLTTDTIVNANPQCQNSLVFFVPKDREIKRTVYIARESTLEPTVPMKKFIALAKEICKDRKNLYIY